MNKLLATGLAFATSLVASSAFPCGGGFGANVTVEPAQTLVVAHKDGVQSYAFQPHFCGTAASFGLILPIPAALASNPKLIDSGLFKEVEKISQPKVIRQTQCRPRSNGNGPASGGSSSGGAPPQAGGVDVVDQGQVGIFDWSLLKADTKESFTDWLDANKFPHTTDADAAFTHYVEQGWYFVAFKVTAGPNAPPAGSKLCGNLGPIELSFPAEKAVIPTRIAQVSAEGRSPSWRLYGISAPKTQLDASFDRYSQQVRYSQPLSKALLAEYPQIAKRAAEGDNFVALDLSFKFEEVTKDLILQSAPAVELQQTRTQVDFIDCENTGGNADPTGDASGSSSSSGCNTSSRSPADLAFAACGVAIAIALGARRRRAKG